MKRIFLSVILLMAVVTSFAQKLGNKRFYYTEASELTLTGKLFTDTPNPYHRVDTLAFPSLGKWEKKQVQQSSGIAVAFRTNSTVVTVQGTYLRPTHPTEGTAMSARGFDLYVRSGGKWVYAGSVVNPDKTAEEPMILCHHMDDNMKECLLYLPVFSEMGGVKVGVEEGSVIMPLDNPFKARIGIFGSSFTQGVSTSRSGMAYPSQFARFTGYQMLNLGCAGNSKLQPYFAEVLAKADIDALIVDGFSNPSPEEMEKRLFRFIEIVRNSHPDIPIIFQKTIYRERRNFNKEHDAYEQKKMDTAAALMKEAVKKYPNVHFVETVNATSAEHDTSVDGTHPGDYGYYLWAKSIEKPVLGILKKAGL